MSLDRYSLAILAELQRDARQTVQQLSAAVGLSATPCWKRVKELEAAGVITGYTALVDREKVGLNLRVVVEANLSEHSEELVRKFERSVPDDKSLGGEASDLANPNLETSIDWDLKNHKGITVASGIYLIHVNAPDLGERTLKWFGVLRPIDLNTF